MINTQKVIDKCLGKNKKCVHCGDTIREGDEYDAYKAHLPYCKSKTASRLRKSKDEEEYQEGF